VDLTMVDDGSRPTAAALAAECARSHGDRVRLIVHPANRGKGAALMTGFDAILARAGGVDAAIGAKAEGEPGVLQSTRGLARIGLEARVELLRSSSDKDQGIAGLRIAEALLAISPRDASLLRATAVCAEAAGELDRAAEALRTLAGGLTPRTNAWFEAKVDQIRVLARLDPARARAVPAPADLWERDPPIRVRQSLPTSWIALTLREGRNRQVRRMTAAVGLPTLRLVRTHIGPYHVQDLPLGTWQETELP
jgi:hypothetical protein